MDRVHTISFLERHHIRPSVQRLLVMEYLFGTKAHPTAEQVYVDLLPQMPTLSRATVYNTLITLSERGLVRELSIQNSQKRFDADLTPHSHLLCAECGQVFDIEAVRLRLPYHYGHSIRRSEVFFYGTCKFCNNKPKK